MRPRVALAVLVASMCFLTGCGRYGLNEFALPGTEGGGAGSYTVDLTLDNVGDLVPNNPVRLNDVDVGTIRSIRLEGWDALVTVSLNEDVKLPRDVTAEVGQSSLLGAKFIELADPGTNSTQEPLDAGATVPLAQTGRYPTTEDTLAAVAALLNGGGLQQMKTITTELNRALSGRTPQYRELLTQVNTATAELESQKGDIVAAIDGLDRLGGRLTEQNDNLRGALDTVPPALEVLNQERANLTNTLTALGNFGREFDDVVQASDDQLAENIANLEPAMKGLADSGADLTKSLDLVGTVIFPLQNFGKIFRGDFINFYLTLDLTLPTIDRAYLSGTPAAGTLGAFAQKLAENGTLAKLAENPLLAPIQPDLDPNGAPRPVPAPANPEQPDPDSSRPAPPEWDSERTTDPQDGGLLGGLSGEPQGTATQDPAPQSGHDPGDPPPGPATQNDPAESDAPSGGLSGLLPGGGN